MAPQMDALSSFVFLKDNLPPWLIQLNDLAGHSSKRQNEFAAEYSRLLRHARPSPKKVKSASLASNRSNDQSPAEQPRTPARTMNSHDRIHINPLEAGNKYLFASMREREKNTGASVRSGASGPRRPRRQKHAVVIYYDSHVQSTLETMVKNLSTARNNLRKGKNARDLLKRPTFSFGNVGNILTDLKPTSFISTVDISPKGTSGPTPSQAPADVEKCFELADKALEQAQNLCESAAHQFLRDADIGLELRNSVERLNQVIKIAEEAIDRVKEEEENAATEEEEDDTAADGECDVKFSFPPLNFGPKTYTSRESYNNIIEVDSDDGNASTSNEEIEQKFNYSRFRFRFDSRQAPPVLI